MSHFLSMGFVGVGYRAIGLLGVGDRNHHGSDALAQLEIGPFSKRDNSGPLEGLKYRFTADGWFLRGHH